MGPCPHDAPRSKITPRNPAGTDDFGVVEFTDKNPDRLRESFSCMGFAMTARHRSKAIDLWQQDDITRGLSAEPEGSVARFGAQHGPCAPAMGWPDGLCAKKHLITRCHGVPSPIWKPIAV